MRFGLYAGGFLGPFGGAILAVLIPQLRDAFGATTSQVTFAITAYLVPFAAFQLVSGTIGERVGIARTVRTAYVGYAAFSVLAAFAPSIEVFIGARALQGAANAFLTPLLLAAVAASSPEGTVGRTVGTFAAVQTTALVAAPLIGGLAGELSWRLAFLAPAVAALGLAALPLPGAREAQAAPVRLRSAMTRRVGWLSTAAFLGYLSIAGLGFLVALRAADAFGLGSTARGALVATFGLAGAIVGRFAGEFADRRGRVTAALVGASGCAAAVPFLGLADSPAALAAAWLSAGAGSAFVWAGVNTMAVEAVPGNRAGATSVVSAFKFAGNACAPLLWLPLYRIGPGTAFMAAAAGSVALGAAVLQVRQR
jgi:MFS family permease